MQLEFSQKEAKLKYTHNLLIEEVKIQKIQLENDRKKFELEQE